MIVKCIILLQANDILKNNTDDDSVELIKAVPLTMTSAWAHRWLWGDATAAFEGFLVYFLGLSSMYILMAIAVDRYIAISKPLLGAKITKRMAVVSCCELKTVVRPMLV
ncbi:melanopsin [Plakobranchus ocellatus]|uniref:Melanopsin n=1 Tax=Plakobranchus ocellatus TaxID=259542 RepID=A0AAV4DEX6_9GAST|nr:melanopsin [Plakobranchus ocellatus]